MSRRVRDRCVLFLLVAGLTTLSLPVPALGQPQSQQEIDQRLAELQRLRQQLDSREANVRHGIADADQRRDTLTAELSELQVVVDAVQARVNAAAAVLAGIQARLDAKSKELDRAERALESQRGDLGRRAAQVYRNGPASLLDMVVGAEGFGEFLRRFAYMMQIVHSDNDRIAEIRRMRARIVHERDAVEKLRDRAAQQMSVIVRERNHAAGVARAVDTERLAAAGELQGQYEQLGDIQRQREQYERETAELEAESQQIAAFLRGEGGGEATVSPRGMIWPVSGPVTSGFGWRTHPIFKTRRFHAGIDIGAPSGTPIRAAATGKVVFAGAGTGYGNHVIVSHGGGVATLYAHLSSIGVSVGTVLARGGRVGGVGCTGYCTGPHLHFEVRVNGEPDNPMRWLP